MKQSNFLLLISLIFSWACQSPEFDHSHDIIVIGGGLMGSSTAWHLSNQGNQVLLVEKQDSIYTQGSSYGEARIARSNNRGNDIWSYLHNRSVIETEKLIYYLNAEDGGKKYSIEDIYTTSPVTYVGRMQIYDRLVSSLISQKVDYEMAISPEEGKLKFGVNLPEDVLIQREYNLHSGTVNPKKLISYLHRAIRKKGNEISYQTRVTDLQYNDETDLYEVSVTNEITNETDLLYSRKIVSAAGPYTGELLKNVAPYFDTLITPQRVFLVFFKVNQQVYNQLSADQKQKLSDYYPVINSSKGTRDGSFFSMIEYYDENDHPIIKIGGHFQRSDIPELDQIWSKEISEDEIEWSSNSTAGYFHLLDLPIVKQDLELVDGYSCVYSLTNTEVPYVTPIPNEDLSPNKNFVVLGGMSGVGAKGAMTYGLIAADLMKGSTQSDTLYNVTSKALGFERLLEDLNH